LISNIRIEYFRNKALNIKILFINKSEVYCRISVITDDLEVQLIKKYLSLITFKSNGTLTFFIQD